MRKTEANEICKLKRRLSEHEKVYLYPLCDLHIGDPHFDESKFRGYLKIISDVPEAYCIFNGDLINCILPGGVGGEDLYVQNPRTAQEQNTYLVDMVKEYDINDKILAIVGGSNHPARAKKAIGHNYDQQFAVDLGLKDRYAEPSCVLFLGVGSSAENSAKNHKGASTWYTIFITHGTAGGRKAGSAINATRDIGALFGVDVIITAHRHLDGVTKDEFFFPDYYTKSMTKIKRMFVNAGTFQGLTTYAQQKCLQPNGTGTPRIRFSSGKKDVHVSV